MLCYFTQTSLGYLSRFRRRLTYKTHGSHEAQFFSSFIPFKFYDEMNLICPICDTTDTPVMDF